VKGQIERKKEKKKGKGQPAVQEKEKQPRGKKEKHALSFGDRTRSPQEKAMLSNAQGKRKRSNLSPSRGRGVKKTWRKKAALRELKKRKGPTCTIFAGKTRLRLCC